MRRIKLGAMCLILASAAGPAAAHDDLNVLARQGLMAAMQLDANVLFAMAKGRTEYDADAAVERASSLKTLSNLDMERLYVEGTSNRDAPGKTRALPDIWGAPEKFSQGFSDMRVAIEVLVETAGAGPEPMSAATIEVGKSCGACHRAFRAKDAH